MAGRKAAYICRQRHDNDQLAALIDHIVEDNHDRPHFLDLHPNCWIKVCPKDISPPDESAYDQGSSMISASAKAKSASN